MPVYGFDDRRDDRGAYPVTDERGETIARITRPTFRARFEATLADGTALCAGHARFLSGWEATEPKGTTIASLSNGLFNKASADLRGGSLRASLQGRAFSREWSLIAESGQPLLTSVPHQAGWFFAQDAWLVQSDGTLVLPEVVAIVQLHRLAVKRRRGNAAASAG